MWYDKYSARIIFGSIVLGGYILCLGTLAFIAIPKENLNLFGQALGALSTAMGVIVQSLWEKKSGP